MTSSLSAFFIGGLLLCSSMQSEAQTILEIRLSGTLNKIEVGGHPDYAIGDTFSLSLQIDDSSLTRGTTSITISSILSSELLINGVAKAHNAVSSVGMEWYRSSTYPDPNSEFLRLQMIPVNNSFYLNPSAIPVEAVSPSVGLPFEFMDLLAFDGASFSSSDFVIIGPLNPMYDAIRGPVTSISVQVIPEPSSVALILGAAAGAWLLSRRNRTRGGVDSTPRLSKIV